MSRYALHHFLDIEHSIGDICDNELFLKRTPTSDRLLAESELRYPYEGSKTLMHVLDMDKSG